MSEPILKPFLLEWALTNGHSYDNDETSSTIMQVIDCFFIDYSHFRLVLSDGAHYSVFSVFYHIKHLDTPVILPLSLVRVPSGRLGGTIVFEELGFLSVAPLHGLPTSVSAELTRRHLQRIRDDDAASVHLAETQQLLLDDSERQAMIRVPPAVLGFLRGAAQWSLLEHAFATGRHTPQDLTYLYSANRDDVEVVPGSLRCVWSIFLIVSSLG